MLYILIPYLLTLATVLLMYLNPVKVVSYKGDGVEFYSCKDALIFSIFYFGCSGLVYLFYAIK